MKNSQTDELKILRKAVWNASYGKDGLLALHEEIKQLRKKVERQAKMLEQAKELFEKVFYGEYFDDLDIAETVTAIKGLSDNA